MIAILAKVFGVDIVGVNAATTLPIAPDGWRFVNQTDLDPSQTDYSIIRKKLVLKFGGEEAKFDQYAKGETLTTKENTRIGKAGAWDTWRLENHQTYGATSPTMQILTYTVGVRTTVENVCFNQDDAFINQIEGIVGIHLNSNYGQLKIPSLDWKYWCYSYYDMQDAPVSSLPPVDRTYTDRQPIINAWPITPVNYNTVLQKARDTLLSQNAKKVAAPVTAPPSSAADAKCQKFYATKKITDDASAQAWIDAQILQMKTIAPDGQNDEGADYVKSFLRDEGTANALKTFLIDADDDAYGKYYGTNPPAYPTVKLGENEEAALASEFTEMDSKRPYVIERDDPWVVASNISFGVGAAAALIAGGLAIAGAVGTGATVAAPTVAVTLGEGGAVTTGAGITLAPGATAMSLNSAAIAGANAAVIEGGIVTTTGLTIPATVAEISAAAAAGTAALTAIGSILTVSGIFLVKAAAAILAVGVIVGVYYMIKAWHDAVIKNASPNPIARYLNNQEYLEAREAYIYNVSKFSLDMYYANQNNQYNKCLIDNGDGTGVFNKRIDTQYLSLLRRAYALAGKFNNAGGPLDLCAGFTMYKEPINWAMCKIIVIFYDFATWLQKLGDKWMSATIGVTSGAQCSGP